MIIDRQVRTALPKPGKKERKISDGGTGLELLIRGPDQKFWRFRMTFEGQTIQKGLGPAVGLDAVPLATARDKALELRRQLKAGLLKKGGAAPVGQTFRDVAQRYMAEKAKEWKSAVHREQWRSSLDSYAYPLLGNKAPADITTEDVMAVLEPHWKQIPDTMSRVRMRIEIVLDAAKADGLRTGENVARWRNHLKFKLAAPGRIKPVEHFAALEPHQVPALMADLARRQGMAALALRFTILTAVRSSEAREMRFSEVNLATRLWTIPAARMKAGKPHEVPLSAQAMEILEQAAALQVEGNAAVFPGVHYVEDGLAVLSPMALLDVLKRRGIKATVHGFRSSFRMWAGEHGAQREVAGLCLAHTIGNQTEQAYMRSTLLARRSILMQEWANFIAPRAAADEVPLAKAAD